MKKIRLDIDALRVQSCPTTDAEWPEGGTVDGHQYSGYATCASACSATNGIVICKSCGPCCIE